VETVHAYNTRTTITASENTAARREREGGKGGESGHLLPRSLKAIGPAPESLSSSRLAERREKKKGEKKKKGLRVVGLPTNASTVQAASSQTCLRSERLHCREEGGKKEEEDRRYRRFFTLL